MLTQAPKPPLELPPARRLPSFPLTVDTVILTVLEGELKLVLVKRLDEPFAGLWALPGGFVLCEESLESAARRELQEATGVHDVYLEQLYTFGEPERDTRGRVVSVAYVALVAADRCPLTPHRLEAEARWFSVDDLPAMAFDHREMLDTALARVRTKLEYTTLGFQLMPATFTLKELQSSYEIVLHRSLDKRNFRRRLKLLDLVEPVGEKRAEGPGRPAELYRFKDVDFLHLREKGFFLPF
jgi:8-oxo-dGTP diphosphatase